MDRMTIYIIALRLIKIKNKLKDSKQISEHEKKIFLLGTGESMPSDPSRAISMIDEAFRQLKIVLQMISLQ